MHLKLHAALGATDQVPELPVIDPGLSPQEPLILSTRIHDGPFRGGRLVGAFHGEIETSSFDICTGLGCSTLDVFASMRVARFAYQLDGARLMSGWFDTPRSTTDPSQIHQAAERGPISLEGNGYANSFKAGGGDDILSGMGGDDLLDGARGRDRLQGGAGKDHLAGGADADLLFGGRGADVLVGGLGADTLSGGTGRDTFSYDFARESRPAERRDVIADFESGLDRLSLAGIDADTMERGDQAFAYIGRRAFSGTAGELRHRGPLLSADVDGDGRADFEIRIEGLSHDRADDILL